MSAVRVQLVATQDVRYLQARQHPHNTDPHKEIGQKKPVRIPSGGPLWTLLELLAARSGSAIEAIPGSALGVHGLAVGLEHGRPASILRFWSACGAERRKPAQICNAGIFQIIVPPP